MGVFKSTKLGSLQRGMHNNKVLISTKIFSLVARFETMGVLLSLAAYLIWSVYQFDVKYVFLNGELEEEAYVHQLQGFVVRNIEDKVYKLKKDHNLNKHQEHGTKE